MGAAAMPKRDALLVPRHTSPLIVVRTGPSARHAGRWCPHPRDQCQNGAEHLSRHRDLGHLERDVAHVADKSFRVILTSFSLRLVSDHGSAVGIASVRMEWPRLYASAWSWRRTALAAKVRHDSRVHLIACLP
jgi:hypothetical protein